MRGLIALLFIVAAGFAPGSVWAAGTVNEKPSQADVLNAFAGEVLATIERLRTSGEVTTLSRIGGYARMPEYFNEVEYRDAASERLLGRVRWIRESPELAQMIELFVHDNRGRLLADYYVSYLVEHRNAPMYALINLHQSGDDLQAFRQFDVFGEKLYERCRGDYFGKPIDISIDSYDPSASVDQVPADLYVSCFGFLPTAPGKFVSPATLAREAAGVKKADDGDNDHDRMEARIADLGRRIAAAPDEASLYLERGRAHLVLLRMEEAVADFTRALKLNDDLDAAYFGRGMALGRLGRLEDGIADLTQFINRNPESSVGYTKRGVRRIWNKDFDGAIKDLGMAVALDENNAEAHDDLGVALAQTGKIAESVAHFLKAKTIDPSYLKVHHNLAMVYYLSADLKGALDAVDDALKLAPDAKSSLLLKASILADMGRKSEARAVREKAEFLPDGNWSERSAIQ